MKEHPIFARFYERVSKMLNEAGELDHRIELAGEAAGRVLEIGAGNGLNFEHYRVATLVVALEPDPHMLALGRARAIQAPVRVDLARGTAERLPFADATFDTVVASLVLCSVRDPGRSAAELARVLRPGGEIRYLEHVRSGGRIGSAVQDAITPVWSMFAGTGAVGIEALSRGAEGCVFVDSQPAAVRTIRENLWKTGLHERAAVVRSDVRRFLARERRAFEVVFLDPPYRLPEGEVRDLLSALAGHLDRNALVAVARPRTHTDVIPVDWAVVRRLAYGDTSVLLCREGP